jgi:class 3 adenylate cyclase
VRFAGSPAIPKIAEHRGRIVKTTGDGLLAEFASVVDAVRCAVELQREMIARNAATPAERRIEFRIGINVGDIIIEDGDIFGDGVNIAARLEALAEPGGICLSAAAHEQVRDRLDLAFDDRGEQQVKNIARPVRVYRIPITLTLPTSRPSRSCRGGRPRPAGVGDRSVLRPGRGFARLVPGTSAGSRVGSTVG